jgi:hypothetical protein
MKETFSNIEIVTFALYLLGGEASFLDAEDIAVKANTLAPGRFAWRKYPDQINIRHVFKALFDATKSGYILGSARKGWMLSENGLAFSCKHLNDLAGVDLSRKAQSVAERQWERREHARMLNDPAFLKFQETGSDNISMGQAEAFFRLDDYVVGQARERKIVRIINAFGGDAELGAAVQALAIKVRGR